MGRKNESFNRGGSKIAPAEIDEVLLGHVAVAQAAAFSVPNARLSEEIAAAVVLKSGTSATLRQLRLWRLDRCSVYKVPRRV